MSKELSDREKLKVLFDYWLSHNTEHNSENERWLGKVKDLGLERVAEELEAVVHLSEETNRHIERARALLGEEAASEKDPEKRKGRMYTHSGYGEEGAIPHRHIELHPIGIIKTPYKNHAPRQPQPEAEGDFRIIVDERWAAGLYLLEKFKYVNVLFCFDRASKDVPMRVTPPGASKSVGVFASRSPLRPNPIALSTVRIKNISNNTIFISGIDALDGTPLLDLKPYIAAVDCKPDAGNGNPIAIDLEFGHVTRITVME
jgi:tRNA-Thr(GGU) m(6)t(6)A37 methyltransferase TsaA